MSRSPFGPAADGHGPGPDDLEALWEAATPVEADDPGTLGGSITGPGGPHDIGGVVVDTGRALWLDDAECWPVATGRRGAAALNTRPAAFTKITGRRMTRETGAEGYAGISGQRGVLAMMGPVDVAAAIVTQLMALAARRDGAWHDRLHTDVTARLRASALVRDDPDAGTILRADSRVLLVDYLEVVYVDDERDDLDTGSASVGYERAGLLFKGRLNKTDRRAEAMVLADHAGAVELCAAIMDGMVHSPAREEFMAESGRRRQELIAGEDYPRVGASGAVRRWGPYLPGEKPGP